MKKIYTTKEAVELLKQGKRVKSIKWTIVPYIELHSNGMLVDDSGYPYYLSLAEFEQAYSKPPFHNSLWIEYSKNDINKAQIVNQQLTIAIQDLEDLYGELKSTSAHKQVEKAEAAQPCCKCHSSDPWNSKGKDGKWYCYLHNWEF